TEKFQRFPLSDRQIGSFSDASLLKALKKVGDFVSFLKITKSGFRCCPARCPLLLSGVAVRRCCPALLAVSVGCRCCPLLLTVVRKNAKNNKITEKFQRFPLSDRQIGSFSDANLLKALKIVGDFVSFLKITKSGFRCT
ncbi:MAG: hypothetical protein K6B12_03215, partial [Clostridiales bacterium]|nr:hypothetical protein [Clostridiales bacterium]